MEVQLPQKSHFSSQEVCQIAQIKPYVLRFWESEFIQISPVADSQGQKIYTHGDLETIIAVKRLLFEEKLNIEQAKAQMEVLPTGESTPAPTTLSYRMTDEEFKKLAQAKANLKKILQVSREIHRH